MASGELKNDAILRGQSNYVRWIVPFRAAARAQELYKLFTGEEKIMAKPELGKCLQFDVRPITISLDMPDQDSTLIMILLEKYRSAMADYKDQRERVQTAKLLLNTTVSSYIQSEIDEMSPCKAFEHIVARYQIDPKVGSQITMRKLDTLFFCNCESMDDYISKFRLLRQDIRELDHDFGDDKAMKMLINGLVSKYSPYFDPLPSILAESTTSEQALKSLEAQLLLQDSEFRNAHP